MSIQIVFYVQIRSKTLQSVRWKWLMKNAGFRKSDLHKLLKTTIRVLALTHKVTSRSGFQPVTPCLRSRATEGSQIPVFRRLGYSGKGA